MSSQKTQQHNIRTQNNKESLMYNPGLRQTVSFDCLPKSPRKSNNERVSCDPMSFNSHTRKPLVCVLLRHLDNVPPPPCIESNLVELEKKLGKQQAPKVNRFLIANKLQTIHSVAQKLIFICDSSNDEFALQCLKKVIQENKITQKLLEGTRDGQRQNCTLMHICATRNNVQCMEHLSSLGLSVDKGDTLGATPLFYACAHNAVDATAFLIGKGANINCRDVYSKSPFYIALKNYHFRIAEMLMLCNVNKEMRGPRGNSCLHAFSELGEVNLVKYLIEHAEGYASRYNDDNENALSCGIQHVDIVQYMCEYYKGEALYDLLKSTNKKGENVVHLCCKNNYFESLLVILATMQKDNILEPKINELLNSTDKNGDTPLIISVKHKSKKLIFFLSFCLEINIDAANNDGDTALHYAIHNKDGLSCKLLALFGGAALDIKNKNKMTCEMLSLKLNFERELFLECRMRSEREKGRDTELKSFEKERDKMQRRYSRAEKHRSIKSFVGMFNPNKRNSIFHMISPRRSKSHIAPTEQQNEAAIAAWLQQKSEP